MGWKRLIRFHCGNTGKTLFGEPLDAQCKSARIIHSSMDEILNSSSPSSSEPIGNNDMIAPVGKLLAPIIPPLFLGIGLNYGEHAKELGMAIPKNPILFMKPSNSIASPNSIITIDPRLQSCVDYEAELAVVIGGSGRECRNVNEKDALDHVLGYTCANDLSERRWQMEIGQWCFAKSFDNFCPLGPMLISPSLILNPQSLKISMHINGQLRQSSSTKDMIFSVASLISFLSQGTTLAPGTVILTGTPKGVIGMPTKVDKCYLSHDDVMQVDIEGIGSLINTIKQEL